MAVGLRLPRPLSDCGVGRALLIESVCVLQVRLYTSNLPTHCKLLMVSERNLFLFVYTVFINFLFLLLPFFPVQPPSYEASRGRDQVICPVNREVPWSPPPEYKEVATPIPSLRHNQVVGIGGVPDLFNGTFLHLFISFTIQLFIFAFCVTKVLGCLFVFFKS